MTNNINNTPCKGCNKRKLGCHETCMDYNLSTKNMKLFEQWCRDNGIRNTYRWRISKHDKK